MARYIDADLLLEKVENNTPLNWTDSERETQEQFDYQVFKHMIEYQPTANVAPMEDVEKLRAENKKLFDEAENQSNLWKQHFESLYETAKETVKADTITEICFRFAVHFSTYTENATVKIKHLFRFLDDMKKEILKGGDTE